MIYYEYLTDAHKMLLEGTSDDEPTREEIIADAAQKGFDLIGLDIWLDLCQHFWRFGADLKKRHSGIC
jgi:hypothetical protein